MMEQILNYAIILAILLIPFGFYLGLKINKSDFEKQIFKEQEKYRLIMESHTTLQKAEEAMKYFIKPALLNEIKKGFDPIQYHPKVQEMTVMACNIRDFTTLTEILSPYQKATFLNQYFSMMTYPIAKYGGEVDKIMGDSFLAFFEDPHNAVRAATEMRLQLQDLNRMMVQIDSPKIRNGIGIARGELLIGNLGSHEKLERTIIGEAINLALRLESNSKLYNVEVLATENVVAGFSDHKDYRWIDSVNIRGSSLNIRLYEIYSHQPVDVRSYKEANKDVLEKAMLIYFNKGFNDASRIFTKILERMPPHKYEKGMPMDSIPDYYIQHCEAWRGDFGGTDLIKKWSGVHIFHGSK